MVEIGLTVERAIVVHEEEVIVKIDFQVVVKKAVDRLSCCVEEGLNWRFRRGGRLISSYVVRIGVRQGGI